MDNNFLFNDSSSNGEDFTNFSSGDMMLPGSAHRNGSCNSVSNNNINIAINSVVMGMGGMGMNGMGMGSGGGGGLDQGSGSSVDVAGYPLLLQQYLNQQQDGPSSLQQQYQQHNQEHQKQQFASLIDNSAMAGLMGRGSMHNSNSMIFGGGMDNSSNGGRTINNFSGADVGSNFNWATTACFAGGTPSITGTQTSSASDLSTSLTGSGGNLHRMVPGRVMGGGGGSSSSSSSTNNTSFIMSMTHPSVAAAASGFAGAVCFGESGDSADSMMNYGSAAGRDFYAEQGILGPWSERSAGLLGKLVCTDPANQGKVKRARRKQPKDKPKRPLSAYNIFFKEERARLLSKAPPANNMKCGGAEKGSEGSESTKRTVNGKIGFENLAKIIGGKWQDLGPDEVEYYKAQAANDMQRYRAEMLVYNKKLAGMTSAAIAENAETSSDDNDDDVAAAVADANLGSIADDPEQPQGPNKKQKLSLL